MKKWKKWEKYLPGAVLTIAAVCVLFFSGLSREEKGVAALRQKKATENESKQFDLHEDAAHSTKKEFSNKTLRKLEAGKTPEHGKKEIADRLGKTDVREKDKIDALPFNNQRKNIEDAEAASPEIAGLTQDYNIPESGWEPILESFTAIRDPGNKQETAYKISKLMDMGTTMLLNKNYGRAEQAFRAVIGIDADANAVKWARMGLIQSLAGQGRNDEAINEKNITMEICNNDEAFVSLIENLPVN